MKVTTVYLLQLSAFLFGLGLFLHGFFPLSFSSMEKADFQNFPKHIAEVQLDRSQYRAKFSRTTIMLIDALRLDFVQRQESMPHVRKLIENKEACLLKLRVQPPTVTMPRIKALTSGTIPSFIDVILNLGSSEVKTDTFLQQTASSGGKLIFYGDSTWTRMFPNVFSRKGENQDPLFVNDFYEGDKNITKNLVSELKHPDWKMMVLHYLGLDHIGHAEGPFSPKVPGKLKEMDEIVRKIVFEMTRWNANLYLPSLFIVTGDHGMRDTGGHGGSSAPEVTVPLLVVGSNCASTETLYNQIDFAATLSVLLGLPIPASSIGNLIPEMLADLTEEEQLLALVYNGERLLQKLLLEQFDLDQREFFLQHQEGKEMHKEYLKMKQIGDEVNQSLFKRAKLFYLSSAQEMSDLLAKNFVKYDLWSISVGLFLSFLTTIASLSLFLTEKDTLTIDWNSYNIFFILFGTVCLKHLPKKFFQLDFSLCSSGLVGNIIILITITIIRINCKIILSAVKERRTSWIPNMHNIHLYVIFCTVFHVISYASSSFIEEEHQLWYYFGVTLFIMLLLGELRRFKSVSLSTDLSHLQKLHSVVLKYVGLLLSHIFLRRLNQTGDKWLSVPDIGDWFVTEENKMSLSWFFIFTLFLVLVVCGQFSGILTGVLTFTAVLLIYYSRSITGHVTLFSVMKSDSRVSLLLFWVNVLEIAAINYLPIIYRRWILKKYLPQDGKLWTGASITIFSLISCLLHKPHNAILTVACILTCQVVNKSINSILSGTPKIFMIILSHLWIGKMFFFYQGNSNSLASIDLNAGYIGLKSFNMIIVGVFLTINTFGGPLLAVLLMLHHLQSNHKIFLQTCGLFLILPLNFYMAIATGFRNHLFVWTVFSPKLLYEAFNYGLFYVIFTVLGVTWCHKS
ncbi:GPI ethanolamine phosphate transferase 2 [Phlebotomus argentipes]|uniref:GPI ethanolamine phosphate transferase 2 n=1 Tax=Phlebotomus argentipes TaxID=94469 RepID=UPI002892CA3E|nr:GPI ethanolamine phosphate transferase 2 [Phlebotomus argentipes]